MGKIILLILNLVLATLADFTVDCPDRCSCLWVSGNKAANCTNAGFEDIPQALQPDIQVLDLTDNDLYTVSKHAFVNAGLINLKKLLLRECKLNTLHKNSFHSLDIMIELDLSKNDLKELHPELFQETHKIRWIHLNDNKLTKLDDGLFSNLPFLYKVDLSNNRIATIGVRTFLNVPKLNTLYLQDNDLEHLNVDSIKTLTSLTNLDMHSNPWICDCESKPLIDWIRSKDILTPISCIQPQAQRGKKWKDLTVNDFACIPRPTSSFQLGASDSTVTLSCQANGNPLPDVSWIFNGMIVNGSQIYQGKITYHIVQTSSENRKWVSLSIENAGN